MKKVLIPTKLQKVAREILEANGNYSVVQDDATPLAELAAAHPDTYALIVRSEKVDAQVIDSLPALKVVIRAGAGYNTIDIQHARRKGVDVMNTPGANANAVAEEVVAMMLADARHLVAADPSTRAGEWEKKKFMGREIAGKTIGIVGLGFIGKLVARRLGGFDVKFLGYDPVLSPDRARELGIELVPLDELFSRSDYVSLHIPENEETRGLVNRRLLERMKEGATLVNCARCGVIDEADLRAVKAARKLRFLNDVFPKDEPGPKPIADVADLLLPHLGANTVEANTNAARRAAQQLIELDEKGITSYIVNRDIPEGLDEAYADLANLVARLCRAMVGRGTKLRSIETSFYGSLKPYGEWLIVPVTAGLSEEFSLSLDHKAAHSFWQDRGIELQNRETDDSKGYHNSMTVDMTAGCEGDTIRWASVRGTVAEGNLMIARVNDFDKLYFEPRGHVAAFVYKDRPGILGRIGAALAEASINIDDVRNPHDSKGELSLAILKVNQPVPEATIQAIAKDIGAQTAFYIQL